ncbi:MAG: chromate resistance protein [Thaumarchaeota archaeon]|nr:chromate resistance protein [Nitrososphaerota archaeon]
MKWVTRERAKVDRIACPWLIKKFIDTDAEFLFVPADKVLSVAESKRAAPFDVEGVEFGHHGDKCTFDALIEKYNLKDAALFELAKIVRGADTDAKNLTPYSNGLEAIAEGFRIVSKNDFENMEKQFPVYDALYAFCKKLKQSS